MSKELTVQERALDFKKYLNSDNIKRQLAEALPKWLDGERFLKVLFSSVLKNPTILECSTESILNASMQCAQLGLEPIMGRAHLVPYNNRKKIGNQWVSVKECQFQPGYQGLVDLGRRSGKIKDITAHAVYKNDVFEIEYGTEDRLKHIPCLNGDRGEIIGCYTVWTFVDGYKSFYFMPISDIHKIRDRSQAYKSAKQYNREDTPWIEWESEMAKKTVIKRHSKLMPASIEFMRAVELDNMADTGKPQVDLFSDDATPQIEYGEPDQSKSFDQLAAAKIDYPPDATLDKFLEVTAEGNGISVEELKDFAARDFNTFWLNFEDWMEKNAGNEKEQSQDAVEQGHKDTKERQNEAEKKQADWPKWIGKDFPGLDELSIDALLAYKEDELPTLKNKITDSRHQTLTLYVNSLIDQKVP